MKCAVCHSELPEGADVCRRCLVRPGQVAPDDTYEYAAFISYRHAPHDQTVAKKVQKAIETYRLPKGVGGWGNGTRRVGRCFRDEDELEATSSLPERIVDALAKSRTLVVICSPAAKESAWVKREVEAFVAMHGRERVFAVLAQGDARSSIPDVLASETLLPGSDEPSEAHPLAADLRPSAARHEREELLRILAAVAGCRYDDLKQRDGLRRRTKAAVAVLAACVLAAALAAMLLFASGAHEQARIADSQRLAAQSSQLLAEGDRYEAIRCAVQAVEALPLRMQNSGDYQAIRARMALEQALGIAFDVDHPWRLQYSVDAEADIVAIQTSPDAGWFAFLDSNLALSFHDITTGAKLSQLSLLDLAQGEGADAQVDADYRNWTIAAAGSRLVASERDGANVFCCIDARTGEVVWSFAQMANALAVSDDGMTADALCHAGDTFYVGAVDVASGELLGSLPFENPDVPAYTRLFPSTMGERAARLFVGFDDTVTRYDLVENEQASCVLPNSDYVSSLACADGIVLAASSTFAEEDESKPECGTGTFTLTAINADMRSLWSHASRWSREPVDSARGYVGLDQEPRICGVGLFGDSAAIATAGNAVQAFDLASGELIYEESFAVPIAGAFPIGRNEGSYVIYVVCADGKVYQRSAGDFVRKAGPTAFQFPGPVDSARIDWFDDEGFYALARSLDDPRRLFAYQAETRMQDQVRQPSDYSLEELVALAHDELNSVAQ